MTAPSVGQLLQAWRHERRLSQMSVAHDAGISPRHLSFVETGRANAGRATLTGLADALDLGLHERNALMLAAGYAPLHPRTGWADPDLATVRGCLIDIVDVHDPFPAMAVDVRGDVLHANRALLWLVDQPGPRPRPLNVYDLILGPDGLGGRIVNRELWTAHMRGRLRRRADETRESRLMALADQYGCGEGGAVSPSAGEPVLPLVLRDGDAELRLASLRAYLTQPHDLTLAEITLETFIPLDEATRARLSWTRRRGRGIRIDELEAETEAGAGRFDHGRCSPVHDGAAGVFRLPPGTSPGTVPG